MQVLYDQALTEQTRLTRPSEQPKSLGMLLLTIEAHKQMCQSADSHVLSTHDRYRATWAASWSAYYFWHFNMYSQARSPPWQCWHFLYFLQHSANTSAP